ncbi:MAG: hypothetical protein K2Q17_13875 [Nitrospiraceae bacterium]|uniref:hypothetical protein n=1 Tax=Nitrospira cf. moscoviensis SBR1015 TaxID=96242 RepID=UPI000A0D7AB3|nr:hypothetical protein [Nitrospira cf. moscoviensis SBR1015]MBY0248747.1 hypothetical protein [Nitrospiraceae bacterium]OQW30195.1 MAG: hypothetical protein A4E20_16800 [Nitrospira sp. SG-bin2]
MLERRWETTGSLTFSQALAVGDRMRGLGLKPAAPANDVICYVEEWTVKSVDDFDQLDPWATEDVTLIHVREQWRGDFFLLSGAYHTSYLRHQDVGTYCSISHPWRIRERLTLHEPKGMFWIGFRHAHSFIRIRLQARMVITPGETRGDGQRAQWLDERRAAFLDAIAVLELPVETAIEKDAVVLRPHDSAIPFFCSWPDAFGPCQFEYNTTDAYEFLVPASKLAATYTPEPAGVRAYLTGFSEAALAEFQAIEPAARVAYRCSVHCPLDELPDILDAIRPDGRLYATLCEFQTRDLLPEGEEASAIIGIVGGSGGFQIEVRLNRAPLDEEAMAGWLEQLIGHPVAYVPLPAFV